MNKYYLVGTRYYKIQDKKVYFWSSLSRCWKISERFSHAWELGACGPKEEIPEPEIVLILDK